MSDPVEAKRSFSELHDPLSSMPHETVGYAHKIADDCPDSMLPGGFGSSLRSPKWYRYNIDGNHDIHPNGAVYAIKTAKNDYKIQIFDYFKRNGSDIDNFGVRYSKL